jgi:tRNA(Ile)-lysidine synthase
LAHFATLAAEDDALLYEYSQALISKNQDGYLIAFSNKKPLFTRACLTAMKGLGLEKDYTAKHLDALFALQTAERGAWLCLPKNIIAEKQEKGIVLNEKKQTFFEEKSAEEKFSLDGFDGGRYALKLSDTPVHDKKNDWKTLKIDAEKLPAGAVFRFRKEGDKISVFGGGTKTLKKFFNEKKVPVQEREYLPLIADKNSDAVYVIGGVEIADSVKVSETTNKILYIQLQKKE